MTAFRHDAGEDAALLELLYLCPTGIIKFDATGAIQLMNPLGVNIHFTDPPPGEVPMLAAAGVRWVRMDFKWSVTEPTRGQYDFSVYDRLVTALEANHLRALFILDYANPLYDRNLSPASEEARQAFASWAAAAVTHFRSHGFLWEIYNEPNAFWQPHPDTDAYIKLALATSPLSSWNVV